MGFKLFFYELISINEHYGLRAPSPTFTAFRGIKVIEFVYKIIPVVSLLRVWTLVKYAGVKGVGPAPRIRQILHIYIDFVII